MKTKDLEKLVAGVVDLKPHHLVDKKKALGLIDEGRVIHNSEPQIQQVAQGKLQQVAQTVAQGSWVAQKKEQSVAQRGPQVVAQQVAQSQQHIQSSVAAKEVEVIKGVIGEMESIEDRKSYLKSLGITIKVERRSNGYYFYGIKKFDGKKERFYCGRVV
jgi:hypothetical protein